MIRAAKVRNSWSTEEYQVSLLYTTECPNEKVSHPSNSSEGNQAKDNESCNEHTIGYSDYNYMRILIPPKMIYSRLFILPARQWLKLDKNTTVAQL